MENSLATLNVLPMTKGDIATFVEKVKFEVNMGVINPLQLSIYLKSLSQMIESLDKDASIREAIRDEADKYPEKTFDAYGAKVSKSSRTTFDYSSDPVYANLIKDKEFNEKMIEARKAVLKSGVDPSTGDTFGQFPSKTSNVISITLK